MAKHIKGGHVAMPEVKYSDGQYEQIFGRKSSESGVEYPEGDIRGREITENMKCIANSGHLPIITPSHMLLDSVREKYG